METLGENEAFGGIMNPQMNTVALIIARRYTCLPNSLPHGAETVQHLSTDIVAYCIIAGCVVVCLAPRNLQESCQKYMQSARRMEHVLFKSSLVLTLI